MDFAIGTADQHVDNATPVTRPAVRPPSRHRRRAQVELTIAAQHAIIEAARDKTTVSGLTHGFYKYPARFPPQMVRAVINELSAPGDVVLDPYAGGATSLVEALAGGRQAVGCDISTLAAFIGRVKTTALDDGVLELVDTWSSNIGRQINIHAPAPEFGFWQEAGYFKNLDRRPLWRLRKAMMQAVESASLLAIAEAQALARCIILRTAQWALESRRTVPSIGEFKAALQTNAVDMIAGMREFRSVAGDTASATYLSRSVIGVETEPAMQVLPRAKLVITSPPYPGVHVLYHRWQVEGRRETGAPFWIANALDGSGLSYYTMGDRKRPGLTTYFENLAQSLGSISKLCADDATIVQVVAFSQPDWQLPRYLEVAREAGLEEQTLSVLDGIDDGRLWRDVPNRRWYAEQRGATNSSREVMLFHRKGD